MARGEADAGIVIDGAGIGSAIAANKIHGIRAAMATTETIARYSREHNGANVLALGATLIDDGRSTSDCCDLAVDAHARTPLHPATGEDQRHSNGGAGPSDHETSCRRLIDLDRSGTVGGAGRAGRTAVELRLSLRRRRLLPEPPARRD